MKKWALVTSLESRSRGFLFLKISFALTRVIFDADHDSGTHFVISYHFLIILSLTRFLSKQNVIY